MKKLQWWFRLVGVFYLLLTVVNLYAIFINKQFLKVHLPFSVTNTDFRVTLDFWFTFVLDLLVTGAFLIWASRKPLKHLNLVWLILWLEAIRGIADDFYMISRGYNASFYAVFTVIHLIVIGTGFVFARQATLQKPVTVN